MPRRPAQDSVDLCRSRRMRPSDLFRDMRDGTMSIVKTCAMLGMGALLPAFVIQARYRDLQWMDYVGFSLAVILLSGGPLASHVIGLMAPRLGAAPAARGDDPKK